MLNLALGTASNEAGRSILRTNRGLPGHAIYGPYEFRDAGAYSVDFRVELAGGERPARDAVCAVLDVVRDTGADVVVSRKIRLSELQAQTSFRLNFTLGERAKLEYRVWTSGAAALELDELRRVRRLDDPADAAHAIQPLAEFPAPEAHGPAYFEANRARFRQLYDTGFGIAFAGDGVVLSHSGIAFHARTEDDFTFIGEVFAENVYNFMLDEPACVVDVGMNIGYSSLQFAGKPNVREVFAFEPFPETFRRAVDNLSLNPALAAKIGRTCAGLSDKDWAGEVRIGGSDNSGSRTVVADGEGEAVAVTLLDAGTTLRPILRSARERGLRTIVKVDCEGSEFAIFRSLEREGLFPEIDAIMVEWHAMFDDVNQIDLIRPLRAAGFIVFDQSPPAGNGFFYGVRLAVAGNAASPR